MNRQQFGFGARAVQGTARLFELDPFDAVGGEDGDTHAAEITSHASSSLLF
jgi:hypothetical protein